MAMTYKLSKKPPKHFTMKIRSFSLLKQSVDRYDSREFEAGGYKWKLVLFPNGNKSSTKYNTESDYISLYLEMAGEKPIEPGWEVTVDFKFFLLSHTRNIYCVVEEDNKKEKKHHCFYRTIVGGLAGFDRFVALKVFSNVSNGYLNADDSCVIGADVFVSKKRSKVVNEERVSMIHDPSMYKLVLKIDNYVSKSEAHHCFSNPVPADQKYCLWKLNLYPRGTGTASGSHLSLFLALANPENLPPSSKIFAEFTLRIVDQTYALHCSYTTRNWFSALVPTSGYTEFIKLCDFYSEASGFLVNDTCIIEADITILGISH